MSGTNRKLDIMTGGPVIILVEPQLGENIGMVARAMANFGLSDLRLVNPRDGWPSEKARAAASRADHVIDGTQVFDTLDEAIADTNYVLATTARQRDMLKTVLAPDEAMIQSKTRMEAGGRVGVLFGRERWGLENDEIAKADEIVTFPVNPGFASLNIAQAVLLMSYEWMRTNVGEGAINFRAPESVPASREFLTGFLKHLESALDDAHYFHPPDKREKMRLNLQNTFVHAGFKEPEIHLLHGVVAALERRWLKKQQSKDTT